MTNSVSEEQGRLVVKLNGEGDRDNARDVRKTLRECRARRRDVLVALSGVTYIDSSGIASLVEGLQTARKNGTGLSLVAVSVRAMRVLALARLDKGFPIHPDPAGPPGRCDRPDDTTRRACPADRDAAVRHHRHHAGDPEPVFPGPVRRR